MVAYLDANGDIAGFIQNPALEPVSEAGTNDLCPATGSCYGDPPLPDCITSECYPN